MRLLITLENHLLRGADSCVYGQGPVNYSIWAKYLEFFDEVALLARVRTSAAPGSFCQRVDGKSVSVRELPDYRGPLDTCGTYLDLKKLSGKQSLQAMFIWFVYRALLVASPGKKFVD